VLVTHYPARCYERIGGNKGPQEKLERTVLLFTEGHTICPFELYANGEVIAVGPSSEFAQSSMPSSIARVHKLVNLACSLNKEVT